MSILTLVLVMFPQSDEAFPQPLDMSRPKLEKQTTSAERMKKWRQSKQSKQQSTWAKYHQNKVTKSTEQLEKEREKLESVKLYWEKNKKKH